jgi:hypothetical protein
MKWNPYTIHPDGEQCDFCGVVRRDTLTRTVQARGRNITIRYCLNCKDEILGASLQQIVEHARVNNPSVKQLLGGN